MRWASTREQHAYMKQRKMENLERCKLSAAERWMNKKLKETEYKWTRQAQWGYRLFDFWNHKLGIAIEVDGPEHRHDYDLYRDNHNYSNSGIVVLRVKNFNEDEAAKVIEKISTSETWNERRLKMGKKPVR